MKKKKYNLVPPYQEHAFSEPVLHKVVLQGITFDLPDEIWRCINNGFASYWNDEIGYGNLFDVDEACTYVYDYLKKRHYIYPFDQVVEIMDIIFSFIARIPGVVLPDDAPVIPVCRDNKQLKTDMNMEENRLMERLKEFKGLEPVSNLERQFEGIAKALFSGYFNVETGLYGRLIIPLSVEFYYHEEENTGQEDRTVDWIMYHRNSKRHNDVPALPTGSLNAHVSGIDITFEDQQQPGHVRYRASALIRKFRVIDGTRDLENELEPIRKFRLINGIQNIDIERDEKRSTKMYDALLMGIPISPGGFKISWVDDKMVWPGELKRGYRHNVALVSERGKIPADKKPSGLEGRFCDPQHFIKINGKQYLHDARKWQFAKLEKFITEDDLVKSNE